MDPNLGKSHRLKFWEERILGAKRLGKPLRTAMYDMPPEDAARYREQTVRVLSPYLSLDAGWPHRVLDLGCGVGDLVSLLPNGVGYLGVDLVPAFIEEGRRAHAGRPDTRFEVCDLTDLSQVDALPGGFTVAVGRWVNDTVGDNVPELWSKVKRRLATKADVVVFFRPDDANVEVITG